MEQPRHTVLWSLITMLMLITLLSACGGQSGTGSSSATEGAATTAPATSQTSATSAATEAAASAMAQPSASAMAQPSASAMAQPSASAGSAQPVADLKGRNVLVGTDATYPPFESVDQSSNKIVGFDVDVMNEIAKLINIKPEFKNASFDTIFTALQSKQFDAVMSAATITEERKKIIAFSDPYIDVGQLVVTTVGNTKIKSYQDLANGAIVGVQTGTTGETATKDKAKVPDDKIKRYQTIDLAFADLANNSIDAVVADGPTVGNYTSQPQYSSKLQIVGEPFTTESYGIAVNQSDTELLNAINAALKQIKANGTIDKLKAQYKIK